MKQKISKKNAIKAYKAFNSDWTCHGFKYEVGKEYKAKGEISICQNGFHACEKACDCFNYYDFALEDTKMAEVLCWGEIEKAREDSKLCCSRIKIIREIKWDEVLKACNSGDGNSGDGNSGYWNSGNGNSGACNSGNWNSGDWNTGRWNSGNQNSGDGNTGDNNSGNRNSGDNNSGNWNSGNGNIGYFNTSAQNKIFCFNQLAEKQPIVFPKFLFFELVEWVPIAEMSAAEQEEHPECDVIGGYLKSLDYKDAFRKSFLNAKKLDDWQEELAKLKAIPKFDYDIFEEISGISKEELEGEKDDE